MLLPYETIRRYVERCADILDTVTTPSLVIPSISYGSRTEDGEDDVGYAIIDWGSAVFGDALKGQPVDLDLKDDLSGDQSIAIRAVLYAMSRSLVQIVGSYYRPTPTSSAVEMAARKRLVNNLAQLGEALREWERKIEEPATPKRSQDEAGVEGGETPGKRVRLGDDGDEEKLETNVDDTADEGGSNVTSEDNDAGESDDGSETVYQRR